MLKGSTALSEPSPATLGLRDPVLRVVLLLTAVLQCASWYGLEGYQLADSVEYMERAHAFVRGEDVVDSKVIRSFGFSAVLTPFFAVAHWIGVEDLTVVVWLVRLFQMSIGLALVAACARIGARLGGRSAGLLGAFVVGVNPVFLQFSVSPLADVAGSLGVALALCSVLTPSTGFRRGLRTGLVMGLTVLMAYKTAPLCLMMMGLVVIRDRRRGMLAALGMTLSIGACALVQAGLDRAVYDVWGASLFAYFGENVCGIIGRLLVQTGFQQTAVDLYSWYYENIDVQLGEQIRQIQPANWYLMHLPEMVVWPVLGGLALGLLRALRQCTWASTIVVLITAGFVFLLHQKGSKEFRLWLPLLATLGPLAGWGLSWIAGDGRSMARMAVIAVALASSIWFGFEAQRTRNTRIHAGYWRALDYIEARVAEEREKDPQLGKAKMASAYHWAVFLRSSSDIDLTKLERQIDAWKSFEDAHKFKAFTVIKEQDWFLVHQPILTEPEHADLAYRINAWFRVEAVFYERSFEDLGPIFVMRRRESDAFDPSLRTLFLRREGATVDDAHELALELGTGEPVRMVKREHREDLWMLGFTYETVPGDGFGWLSTWWYNPERFLADYTLVTRLTTFDERNSWQANERPTWGVFPTNTWKPGTLVRDSRLVIAAEDPYAWKEPFRPMGGAYRRGDYMPARLWIDLATFYLVCNHCGKECVEGHECGGLKRAPDVDATKQVSGRLERARAGEDHAARVGELTGATVSPEGWRWSGDDLALVGRFFLPVLPAGAVLDDGRPIPD